MHRKESRPELPQEALDTFQTSFFWTILNRKERPEIEKALLSINQNKITRLKNSLKN